MVVVARFWLFGSFVVSWFGGLAANMQATQLSCTTAAQGQTKARPADHDESPRQYGCKNALVLCSVDLLLLVVLVVLGVWWFVFFGLGGLPLIWVLAVLVVWWFGDLLVWWFETCWLLLLGVGCLVVS